jgi:primosomal protein N' (replication factor Y)
MLSYPDFRAHERSFQLMAQVSGRAGRKNKQGKVIIQTWKPKHHILQYVLQNNYLAMFNREMTERKKFNYPPYVRLIRLILKHKDLELLKEGADAFARELRTIYGRNVYGPEFPVVSRIRGLYLNHILLKNSAHINHQIFKQYLKKTIDKFREITKYRSIIINIDVDPQ